MRARLYQEHTRGPLLQAEKEVNIRESQSVVVGSLLSIFTKLATGGRTLYELSTRRTAIPHNIGYIKKQGPSGIEKIKERKPHGLYMINIY